MRTTLVGRWLEKNNKPFVALLAAGATLAMATLIDASSSSQIEQLGLLAVPRTGHAATALADGRVLITGGRDSAGKVLGSCRAEGNIGSARCATTAFTTSMRGLRKSATG